MAQQVTGCENVNTCLDSEQDPTAAALTSLAEVSRAPLDLDFHDAAVLCGAKNVLQLLEQVCFHSEVELLQCSLVAETAKHRAGERVR
jgi:hypothetical protein